MPSPSYRVPVRSLSVISLGEMVEIREIPIEFDAAFPLALRRGEVVQCLGHEDGSVTVARADGSRTSVPHDLGRLVQVRPFDAYGVDDLLTFETVTNGRSADAGGLGR